MIVTTPTLALNAEQLEAVASRAACTVVVAPPGSGKTATLISRVVALLQEEVSRASLLIVTFTRRAARELRSRLSELILGDDSPILISTLHALAYRLLVEYGAPTYRAGLAVVDAEERQQRIAASIQSNGFQKMPGIAKAVIGKLGDSDTAASDASRIDWAARRIVRQYHATLQASNAVDLDQMIAAAAGLLAPGSDVGVKIRRRWSHVLVDEAQDLDASQWRLLDALSPQDLFLVGDPDQAIYQWRGACPALLREHAADARAKIVRLSNNYRSVPGICSAADQLIARNPVRLGGSMVAMTGANGGGPAVCVRGHSSPAAEAAWLVADLERRVLRDRLEFGTVAVLARTNWALREVEQELATNSVPIHQVAAKSGEWVTPGMRWLVALLRLIINPSDDRQVLVVLEEPGPVPPALELAKWRALAHESGKPLLQAIVGSAELPPGVHQILTVVDAIVSSKLGALVDLWTVLGALEEVPAIWSAARVPLGRLRDWVDEAAGGTVSDFLAWYVTRSTVEETAQEDPIHGGVTLSTVHGAKGCEWRLVYVVGVEEGLFPSEKDARSDQLLEESRRLAYVAATRARQAVIWSYCRNRRQPFPPYSSIEARPSRFLSEMGLDVTDEVTSESENSR